jgi:hypothetical protein
LTETDRESSLKKLLLEPKVIELYVGCGLDIADELKVSYQAGGRTVTLDVEAAHKELGIMPRDQFVEVHCKARGRKAIVDGAAP